MPIQIDRARAAELGPRIDEALEIVCNEFEGLEVHRRYRNVYSRLLKPDPLGRVAMMGTDQRDLFRPSLREAIAEHVPAGGSIFDFGAGDGQTFALVADSVPEDVTVSLEEPSPAYLDDYVAYLQAQPHLKVGAVLEAGLDEIDEVAPRSGVPLPSDGSIDLALAMHVIYFASSLDDCLTRLVRFVRPGGGFFCVVADEEPAYGGQVLRAFLKSGGAFGDADAHHAAVARRQALLAPAAEGGEGLWAVLEAAGISVDLVSERQPSRLYGHSLSDMLAFSSLSVMVDAVGSYFEIAARTLRDQSEEIDLRIETDGVRKGMWSVQQPQWVTRVRRIT